uniref:Uncharacterized protein n=1 Tax=Magallana gigas TaxID=29159 RepID=A0A8W8NX32_MAGGI
MAEGLEHKKRTSRKFNPEDKEAVEENVLSLYKDCESFILSNECTQDLRNELEESIPDCLTVLRKWINDLENSDHGIVIAGRNNESTSTICKLRNSDKIRVKTTNMKGEQEETDLTDKCNLETKEGVKMLRDFLKDLTDLTSSEKSVTFKSVEVELTFPLLEGNMILVDTPGIGGSGNVTDKLIEYLPNALLFIFVINAGSAGGMQNDRLPQIIKAILLLHLENEMPCFHPQNVIFITNKWDTLFSEDDSSDEDEETKTWNTLKTDIKRRWPSVSSGKSNSSITNFEEFKRVLGTMVKTAENNRLLQHLGLEKSFFEKNTEAKEDIAQECYDYMSTSAGRTKVLNPPDRTPIADINWGTTDFEKEIEARVDLYVEKFLQSDGVLKRYECIQIEINKFCEQVISDLSGMEKEWIESFPDTWSFSPTNVLLSLGALTSPVWMAALAVGFGLAAAALAGVAFLIGAFWGWFTRKTDEEINNEYNKHLAKIRRKICDHLDENCGVIIIKLIVKVTEDVLPKKLKTFKTMIEQISETKDKIKANKKRLKVNAVKIRNMEDTVTKLSECLNS